MAVIWTPISWTICRSGHERIALRAVVWTVAAQYADHACGSRFPAVRQSFRTCSAEADEALAEGLARDQVLIAGTGPLVATADRADKDHAACRELLESDEGPLVTTAAVIAEAA
jgi:hypothetical protein